MHAYLDFEKPVADLDARIEELRRLTDAHAPNIQEEISRLEKKSTQELAAIYGKLTPWQRVQIARHQDRPHALAYIKGLIEDFTPLAGDRCFGEDCAIVGGLGRFQGNPCVVLGQEKGSDTETRLKHNFGMPKPEGYRKAVRLMELAEHYQIPVLTFVDTSGAYPGIEAEERGQAEAIARSIQTCLGLTVPMVATVIGEGGSGGAIAIAAADRVLMLENAVYSVISPEGCASILWRDSNKKMDAAVAQKLTAQDLLELKVIDGIIPEPMGGAHRSVQETIKQVGGHILNHLKGLQNLAPGDIKAQRREKYLNMGRQFLSL